MQRIPPALYASSTAVGSQGFPNMYRVLRFAIHVAPLARAVASEDEFLEFRHRAAGEGRREGVHALVTDLVLSKAEDLEVRQHPAGEGCAEGLHATITDLVLVEVETGELACAIAPLARAGRSEIDI
eukprot:772189-Prymnesium_polylepis.1